MPSVAESGPAFAGIVDAIAAAGGALRFDDYMRLALYGDDGFYTGGGMAGRRGDFITSSEVGPLFGVVVAAALDAWWVELGRPDPYTVIEAGAGPGTLARSILAARPACAAALRYVAVEVSAAQRALHPVGVVSVAEMPTEPFVGIVLANELLDNLPFRILVHDGEWREASVIARDGRLSEVTAAIPDADRARLPRLPERPVHGTRLPWQTAAATWVAEARRALTHGRLVAIDYCTATTAAVGMGPWRAWLRTYAGHERGGHYLTAPGAQDITAQVIIDQLPEPDAVRTQAQFLQRWGIDELVEAGRAAWAAAASAPTVEALKMRSRVREAEALLDPAGLGGFAVLEWRVG